MCSYACHMLCARKCHDSLLMLLALTLVFFLLLVYEFLRLHQPFIYPRSPTPDLLDEVAGIKRRIEHDIAEDLERDVKLGRGGIREIEFVVQTLQFIHGGRHAFLQEANTLHALRALANLELVSAKEV